MWWMGDGREGEWGLVRGVRGRLGWMKDEFGWGKRVRERESEVWKGKVIVEDGELGCPSSSVVVHCVSSSSMAGDVPTRIVVTFCF